MTATILLVEDNEMNRDMLSRRLSKRGYRVILAADGAAALSQARAAAPDVILMDMSLPVLDGWEATRRLKADPATRGMPVIGLTAHAMPGDREKALSAGVDEFDTKPVDLERLLGKISALLRAGSAPGIERPGAIEHLPALVGHAVERCQALGGTAAACGDVRLAVEEVCVNIIKHGYRDGEPGPIRVSVADQAGRIAITIEDEAPRFDPAQAPAPDLTTDWEERQEGGLGWHLVRSVMDEIRYVAPGAAGNRVTLIKDLGGGG